MLANVFPVNHSKVGDVAQLGERGVRNAEARGSIPLISTRNQSKKIQRSAKPVRNSGFFVVFIPKTCYKVHYNSAYLGADSIVKSPQKK